MTRPDELVSILDRILNGCQDEGDVAILCQSLKASGGQNVVQLGKYNVNIGEGKDIHVGDKVYQGADAETIRSIILEVLSQNTRQLEIDWHNISQAMLSEQQRLTTNPLTSGEGITYRTEQVYVPLGLMERKKPTRRREDVLPEQGSELYRETEITQTFEHQQFLEQVLRQRQSPKSQGRRIAIIGEPGAGKTTLLQQIARWVSLEIGQSVVIWVSLADLQGRELESYLLEVWLQAVARKVGQAEPSIQVQDDFVAQFNQGLVWLLLDGVDEMQATVGNPLGEIERQIRTGTLLQQARIVLSCRLNLWDGVSNALDSFDNYRTLEFSYPQQVEQFIGNWSGSLPSVETQTGQRLCAALRESGKERIRDLVKNPLRLTLLCFNWYLGEGKLPETKAGLYEQFVADFYDWKKGLFATTGKQRRRLNAALGELAQQAIDKEATRFRLRQEFVCEYLGEPDDADSLFGLALRLGWLNKVGVDSENPRKAVYAFFHPTFQEYFAALAIDDWHYFLNHVPENPSHSDANYRIFESRWKEVILLWFGQKNLNQEQKETFTQALVEFKDGCGDRNFYSYRAYLLAAIGIAEYRNCSLVNDILARIIQWVLEDNKLVIYHRYLSRQTKKTISENLEKLQQEGWVTIEPQQAAFQTLIEMGLSIIRDKVLQIITQNQNEEKNEKLIEALGILGKGDSKIIMSLSHIAQITKSRNIRKKVIGVMGNIGKDDTTVIKSLIQIIQIPETQDIRQENDEYLKNRFTQYLEDEFSYLMHMSRVVEVEKIRLYAAQILVNIGEGNLTAISLLAELFKITEDRLVRQLIAEVLEEIDPNYIMSSDIDEYYDLYNLRHFDIDEYDRSHILRDFDEYSDIFAQQNQYTEDEYDRLHILRHYDEYYREYWHSHGDYSDIEAQYDPFCVLLYEYEGWQQRSIDNQPVEIEELIKLIKVSDSYYDSWIVAKKLLQIDPRNKTAILTLKELSNVNDDNAIQWLASEDLLQLEPSNTNLISILAKLLSVALDEIYPDLKLRFWKLILDNCKLSAVVTAFSDYASNQFDVQKSDYLEILWLCAQNMSYPDFYNAWNNRLH